MEIINTNKNKSSIRKIRSDKFLKGYLERCYIDEKKSLAEISRICGCSSNTIKNKLEKYGIPVRPYGSFLVGDDGETLNSKRDRGEISGGEYNNIRVKNKGYENVNEYNNELVKNMGYENINDYNNKMNHKNGRNLPMNENNECSMYLGVYIAERILPLLFENVEKMPNCNKGYDFICNNDYKIDVKSACLFKNKSWTFDIYKNKIADYFFMVALDDRENLNIIHIWLVKGNSVIEKTNNYWSREFVVNEKDSIIIGKGNKALERWIKYEKTDMLEKAQKICNSFKNKNKCKID